MKHPDFFTGESEVKENTGHFSTYQIFKQRFHYRKSDDKKVKCGNCRHHISGEYHDKTLHKCELLGFSHSEATDIRVGHVCDKFWKDRE